MGGASLWHGAESRVRHLQGSLLGDVDEVTEGQQADAETHTGAADAGHQRLTEAGHRADELPENRHKAVSATQGVCIVQQRGRLVMTEVGLHKLQSALRQLPAESDSRKEKLLPSYRKSKTIEQVYKIGNI